MAAPVAIAIRDPRCFPAGPAPGPIYLPPLSSRKSNSGTASQTLAASLRRIGVVWFVFAAAASASIVSAVVNRESGRQTEFTRHVASIYRPVSQHAVSQHAVSQHSFVDRWGDSEFFNPTDTADSEEPVFYTKPVRTVRFTRPTQEEPAVTASVVGADGPAASGRPRFPVAFTLASVDSKAVDIGPVPAVRDKTATDKIVVDKDVAELDEVSQYLWEVYQRQPIKKDGAGDFTWKDPAAAKRMNMSMPKYVILGMDPDFREQLYHAGKAMDAAGLKWSILSAFRDDYRQRIASGIKAAASNSLHGGLARTGGYGHGRAVDVTNADGDMDEVWDWFDDHGGKYGLHRPMPGYDPAHIQQQGDWRKVAASLRAARLKAAKVASASAR